MDAVNLGTECYFAPCSGTGPWVEADMENGLSPGATARTRPTTGNSSNFVTAMLKNNGQTTYALKGGNAQSGGLRPGGKARCPTSAATRRCIQKAGSCWAPGATTATGGRLVLRGRDDLGLPDRRRRQRGPGQHHLGRLLRRVRRRNGARGHDHRPGGQCVDVIGDDSGTDGAAVDLWDCQSVAVDQHWTHNSDDSLSTLGRCLDIDGDGTAPGTKVELWDCNGVGGQNGSSRPTARCSTRSRGCAWTTRAATPRTGPSCRSGPATARRRRCSRSTAAA